FAPSALVLPIVAGGLLLRPASLLGLYAAAGDPLVTPEAPAGPERRGVSPRPLPRPPSACTYRSPLPDPI
ncbi:hypothetical protein ABZ590_24060, partial [Streptomyces hirsutus]